MSEPKPPKLVMGKTESLITVVLVLTVCGILMYALEALSLQITLAIERASAQYPTGAKFGVTCILLTFAIGAYYARERQRIGYGCVELLVGLGVAWTSIRSMPDGYMTPVPPASLLQPMGAIYIMVRGLDNIAIGVRLRRISQ